MEPADIRRTAIIAMFSDDLLMERLVLKGGNALDLVHRLTGRGSLDIDFSIEGDFDDLEDIKARCFRALRDRFDSAGLLVFDEKFLSKPSALRPGHDDTWGGYRIEFKLIAKKTAAALGDNLEARQRNAQVIGFAQEKIFTIEISKYEFCAPKVEKEFDDYTIYVYPPELIAAEKLRAICQQMPEYLPVRNKRARARDFYDVHRVVTGTGLDMASSEFHELVLAVFEAKTVPLWLLRRIPEHREFHRPDWPAVLQALKEDARRSAQEFDFYFDFVLREVEKLEPLWHVETPV
jgi:hypothetical protein